MRKIIISTLILLVIGASGYGLFKYNKVFGLFDSPLVTACEELITNRLRSPSTYHRIEISEYEEPIPTADLGQYFDENQISRTGRSLVEDRVYTPTNFKVFVRYEAANAYGTPVANLSLCERATLSGDLGRVYSSTVKIDGKTETEWLIEAVLESNN